VAKRVVPAVAIMLVGCVFALRPASAAERALSVRITPPSGLLDVPITAQVAGATPGGRVVLRVRTTAWDGVVWQAQVAGRANSRGRLMRNLSALLPALRPADRSVTASTRSAFPAGRDLVVHVVVLATGRRVAAAKGRRALCAGNVSFRPLTFEQDGLVARYWASSRAGRRPAVLTLGGSEGGLRQFSVPECLLARHGYPVLELGYFGLPGLPPTLERIPLEYFERALKWLAKQQQVDSDRIVLVGSSRGAELALLLGSRFPALVHSVAAYAPSSVVNAGLTSKSASRKPAWTHKGKGIPFARSDEWGDSTPEKTPAAVIPVERIRGAILLVSGVADDVWPAAGYASAIADRLRAHGRRNFASIVYPYAGHGVAAVIPFLPLATTSTRFALLGDQNADARVRTAAWFRLRAMLERLRG
jgi:dienelactone hydrolase